jgi:predicted ArsR family transcriptional regulator
MDHQKQTDLQTAAAPVDDLNARIGVLTRREVEARILKPIVEALGEEFGRERVLKVLRKTIVRLAQTQGAELAEMMGGNSSAHFNDSRRYWTKDGALEIELLEQNDGRLSFNVTRCRYAELYQALGLAELGSTLSCNRDFALIGGFNPEATLERTQTIMDGAAYCDFRYAFPRPAPAEEAEQ